MKKIVIIDELDRASASKVMQHLQQGHQVYFRKVRDQKTRDEICKENPGLIDLADVEFDYTLFVEVWKQAYLRIEEIFKKDYDGKGSITNIERLYGQNGIKNLYRKKLLDEIIDHYELVFLANKLIETDRCDECEIYIKDGLLSAQKKEEYSSEIMNKVIKIVKIKSFAERIGSSASRIGYLLYPWYILLKKIRISRKKGINTEFKIAITVDQPAGIFSRNYYGESILIDEQELPKSEVLFIDESGKKNKEEYDKLGYNQTSLKNDRWQATSVFIKNNLISFLKAWFRTIVHVGENRLLLRTSSKAMTDYLVWNLFLENYKINKYVRRLIPDPISKIEVLRKRNIETWLYYPDNYSVGYHTQESEKELVDPDLKFIEYDYVVVYGNKIRRYFEAHCGEVKKYLENGVVYSQIAEEIANGKIIAGIDEYIKKRKFSKKIKIIGVFDTTFSNKAPLHIIEGVKFGKDILSLLEDFKDIAIIFKVKYPWNELDPHLKEVYKKLKEHERCILYPIGEDRGSSPEVIAKSELVISAAYTSTTVEALGARKKAIYYDASGKERGQGYYFNKFPKLVAHDYEDLRKLVQYWLYETDGKIFDEYLSKYIKHEFDPYLDGKALSRLRKQLIA